MLQGVFTALPTPFSSDGKLDVLQLQRLLHAQLAAGVHGVVLLGTTAETPTLTPAEKQQILEVCVPLIRQAGRQLIIGAGTNNTVSTVENVRLAAAFKPDAALVVTPYYNKPNPAGMRAHFQAAAEVGVPLLLYHIPGRTGQKLSAAVLQDLLTHIPQLVGIKESDYDMAHLTDTAVRYTGKISYLCGNDDLFLPFLALHGAGIISAAASVCAPAFVRMYDAWQAGKTTQAFALFSQIYPLIKACYLETNPTCIKYILARLGFGTAAVRLPLGEIAAETKTNIDTVLTQTPKEFLIK